MTEIGREICVHWTSADTLFANERNKHFHARKPVRVEISWHTEMYTQTQRNGQEKSAFYVYLHILAFKANHLFKEKE